MNVIYIYFIFLITYNIVNLYAITFMCTLMHPTNSLYFVIIFLYITVNHYNLSFDFLGRKLEEELQYRGRYI